MWYYHEEDNSSAERELYALQEEFDKLERELSANIDTLQEQEMTIKFLLECLKQTKNPNLTSLVAKQFSMNERERLLAKSLYEELAQTEEINAR